ncbi:MAG: 6-phosphogluconolactonase [Cyanobacteria bacterium J06642_2]
MFPFPTSAGDPAIDAAAYAETLKQVFEGGWPDFDCNVLGVGGDGYTASLFPGTDAQRAGGWPTVGNKSGEPRLTLTVPAIEHSHRVKFWVNGVGKASIIKTLPTDQVGLPAQQIKPEGELIWMLDAAAAAELPLLY